MKTIRVLAFAAILTALLCMSILPCFSEDTVLSGSCGPQASWSLNLSTGELVISGRGDMNSYSLMNVPPWFANCNAITSVTVEEGVTSLGSYAFLYCTNLTSVSLPDSLASVGGYVFSNCRALTEIDLGDNITTLGNGAFMNCVSLKSVDIPDAVTVISGDLFSGCTGLTAVELPATLTAIGNGGFQNCSSLAGVSLPVSLKSIETNAFKGCSALTEMILPEGVTAVGSQAFSSCTSLNTLSLPRTLTEIGDSVISGATPKTVLFNGTADEWAAVQVGTDNAVLTSSLIYHPDHVFDREAVDPLYLLSEADCVTAALYRRSCVCGEAGEATFTVGDPLGHIGGEASCHAHAVCDRCQQPYGELKPHTPNGIVDCTTDVLCAVCNTILESALGHAYTSAVTPPTCTEAGYTTHTCTRCGDVKTDTPSDALGHTDGPLATCTEDQLCTVCGTVLTPRLDHSYTETVTKTPTCTEAGVKAFDCIRCDHGYTEILPPIPHTEGEAATCTTPQVCTVCHTVLSPASGHDYRTTVVAPSCTEQGHTAHTCIRCDHTYLDAFTPAVGHTDGPAATCTTPQFCTVCYAVLADKLGHDYRDAVIAPTCIELGHTKHTCSRCEHVYLDTFTLPVGHTKGSAATCTAPQLCTVCDTVVSDKLGHDYRNTVISPTCTEQGHTRHTCSRCDHTYLDAFAPAVGHTHGTAATCTAPQTCTVCDTIVTDKLGHDYRATIVSPTCTEQGYISHVCSRCELTYQDTYTPAVGHTRSAAATCAAPQVCTTCRTVLTPAVGHTPGDEATCAAPRVCTTCQSILTPAAEHDYTVVRAEPTCTLGGYVSHTCKGCGEVLIDENTQPTGHTAGPVATCTTPQTCTVCHAILAEPVGHAFTAVEVAPTCTTDGEIIRTCDTCGYIHTELTAPATGHTAGDWILDNLPDVGKPGRQHKTCEECDALLERETFWEVHDTDAEEPTDPDPNQPSASEDGDVEEDGGCRVTGGNILVVVIILLAGLLLWFLDLRRR